MILNLYRRLAPALAATLPLLARRDAKLRATLAWRREAPPDLAALRALRARSPRLWLHAASAGELEQALPLLAALRERHPGAGLLLTLGSASARPAAERVTAADAVLPIPPDTARAMGALLDAFRPGLVAAVKWDVWPNLVLAAAERGVPVLLVGAVLGADSGRARWPGRLLARPLHRRLAAVGAASEADAAAFLRLGVEPGRLVVTGDTRFDRVLARRAEGLAPALSGRREDGFCIVGGSTWPPEEDALLAAMAGLLPARPRLRLLLVPHEPNPAHLERLDAAAARRGLPLWRLSERPELVDGGICVADRIGILPELYALGRVAVVGGGFGRGVHSVLEPAAQGLPVLCGPRLGRADEARRLAAAGGAFVLGAPGELEGLLRRCLEEPGFLAAAAEAASGFVAAESGATARSLALIAEHLPTDSINSPCDGADAPVNSMKTP